MITEYEFDCLRAVIAMAKRNYDYRNSVNGFPCYYYINGDIKRTIEYQEAVRVVSELYLKLRFPGE